jgi:uncharacterized protein YnzC (UPF0291/DUF896 family)
MPQISASVDAQTIVKINELAKKEKRSFSEMVNILLTQSVNKSKK